MFVCIYFFEDATLSVVDTNGKQLTFLGEIEQREAVEMMWGKKKYKGVIIKVDASKAALQKFTLAASKKILQLLTEKPAEAPEELFSFSLDADVPELKEKRKAKKVVNPTTKQKEQAASTATSKDIVSELNSQFLPPSSSEQSSFLLNTSISGTGREPDAETPLSSTWSLVQGLDSTSNRQGHDVIDLCKIPVPKHPILDMFEVFLRDDTQEWMKKCVEHFRNSSCSHTIPGDCFQESSPRVWHSLPQSQIWRPTPSYPWAQNFATGKAPSPVREPLDQSLDRPQVDMQDYHFPYSISPQPLATDQIFESQSDNYRNLQQQQQSTPRTDPSVFTVQDNTQPMRRISPRKTNSSALPLSDDNQESNTVQRISPRKHHLPDRQEQTTPRRTSPRKNASTFQNDSQECVETPRTDSLSSPPDNKQRLMDKYNVFADKGELRKACALARKAARPGYSLAMKVLPSLFSEEEMALSRGQGLTARKDGDMRPELDKNKIAALKDYCVGYCKKNSFHVPTETDLNVAITERVSYARKLSKRKLNC